MTLAVVLVACDKEESQLAVNDAWYEELPNPTPTDSTLWTALEKPLLSWASIDTRYPKEAPYTGEVVGDMLLTGWRGEMVAAQLVVSTPIELEGLQVKVGDLKSESGETIEGDDLLGGFIRYVMTDELNKDGQSGCGLRPDATAFDSLLVADPIDHLLNILPMEKLTTTGYWVRVNIPQSASPGLYSGVIQVSDGNKEIGKLNLTVEVLSQVLPAVADRSFRLDLWQNPFAVARYHNVEPWTDEHFEVLKPYMELYRDGGGGTITASITHKPWHGQTYDYFESMVKWIKKADGTWEFDYTIFDKWISFMLDLGVNRQIDCYSMVPWQLSFMYFDEATEDNKFIDMKPGDKEYTEIWSALLSSFAQHLKDKGWFGITHIAMDERPKEDMLEVYKLIKSVDPEFKVSLAGNLHEELVDKLDYYAPALRMPFTEEQKQLRRDKGFVTTFYTCCTEARPNTFTFSEPAETVWYGWYAASQQIDGYLRWAFNSWVKDPLLDSRYINWAGGDTYLIYPGPRTSIRFERLREGIEDYTKVMILRQQLTEVGDIEELARMDKVLSHFKHDQNLMLQIPAAQVVNQAQTYLADLSRRLSK